MKKPLLGIKEAVMGANKIITGGCDKCRKGNFCNIHVDKLKINNCPICKVAKVHPGLCSDCFIMKKLLYRSLK